MNLKPVVGLLTFLVVCLGTVSVYLGYELHLERAGESKIDGSVYQPIDFVGIWKGEEVDKEFGSITRFVTERRDDGTYRSTILTLEPDTKKFELTDYRGKWEIRGHRYIEYDNDGIALQLFILNVTKDEVSFFDAAPIGWHVEELEEMNEDLMVVADDEVLFDYRIDTYEQLKPPVGYTLM